MKGKVCIIGSAPSKSQAPYNDDSYDIWAVSGAAYSESLGEEKKPDTVENGWNNVHRVDLLFEMHKRPVFTDRIDAINASRIPVVMLRKEKDIPLSEAYQADEIALSLGGEDYSSTIAYMLAMAISLGYKTIEMYGVVMLHKTEYVRQHAGVKYYIGMATARGIKVIAPPESQLTAPLWRYGYDDHDGICGSIEQIKASLRKEVDAADRKVQEALAIRNQTRGAEIVCDDIMAKIKGGLYGA